MMAIDAAFCVNCVSTLEERLNSACQAGISFEEITMIARLAMYIKKGVAEEPDSN